MAELAGTNSIEYYLKGRALKQNRDAQEARALAAQQKMEQDLQIAKERQSEVERWHQMQNEINLGKADRDKLNLKLRQAEYKSEIFGKVAAAAKAIQLGEMELVDPNQGFTLADPETGQEVFNYQNLRPTAKGTAASQRIDEKAKTALALIPSKVTEARETRAATHPYDINTLQIRDDFNTKDREDRQVFTAEQNALNRAAQRANTLTRAEAVYSNKAAKQEEKNEVSAQMTEDYLPDILSGAPEGVLEALPKGELGLKLRNSVKARGYSILTRKQAENLDGMKRLQSFYDKAETLRALIADGAAKNFSTIKQLQDELAGDLVIFGREAKAEKGVVTDKDIDRLRAAIPSMFPGGAMGLLADKNKANQRRVSDIKKAYHEKVRGIIGGKLKIDQKRAIYDRYQLMPDIPEHLERVE